MLKRFYAVTATPRATSLYCVTSDQGESKTPCMEKIALKGNSKIPVGDKLGGGGRITIAKFLSSQDGHSADIVALFKGKKAARHCFNQGDLLPCDHRWLAETKEVLKRIGEEHPAFEVCHSANLELISA